MPFQEYVLKSARSRVTAAFFYSCTVKFAQARIFGDNMRVSHMKVRGQWLLDLPDLLHHIVIARSS